MAFGLGAGGEDGVAAADSACRPERCRPSVSPRTSTSQKLRRTSLGLFPLLYAAAAWLLFAHLSLFDTGRIPGCACEDPINQVWFLAFAREQLAAGHISPWTDLMGYPAGFNAAGSASFPLLGLLAAPITSAVGPVGAYNFLLRLGLFVSALSGWFVLRRLVASSFAAGVGGLVYGFSPYVIHVVQFHMFLAWVPLPPIILYLLYDQIAEAHGTPWKTGVAVGLLIAAQYLIDAEIAASVVVIAVIGGVVIAAGRTIGGYPVAAGLRSAGAVSIIAVIVAAVVLAYPIWQFLYGPQHVGAIVAGKSSGVPAVTTLLAPSAPNVAGNLSGNVNNLAGNLGLLSTPYAGLFGGIGYLGPMLIVSMICTTIRNRGRTLVWAAAVLLVVSWILALGPYLTGTESVSGISLPMRWILCLPALRDLVAGRLTLYMWLAVAVLVSIAIDEFLARVTRASTSSHAARRYSGHHAGSESNVTAPVSSTTARRAKRQAATQRRMLWASGVVASLAVAGLILVAPDGRIQDDPTGASKPFLAHRIQAQIPSDGLVLTYPYPTFPYDAPMLWQAEDNLRFKLVGGYAKFPGTPVAYLTPPLLQPTAIPCFLSQAEFPAPDWHSTILGGCPLAQINLTPSLLRDFVNNNHVSAIVLQRAGADPERVIQLVTATYGQPAESGLFLAWRT
jgi:hypothetical protein